MTKVKMTTNGEELVADFNDSDTAKNIIAKLPLDSIRFEYDESIFKRINI